MISNRKVGQTQALYLKQFFQHYFERKTTVQTFSSLSSGLSVLQSLISNFQTSKGIRTINSSSSPSPSKSNISISTINAIQKQSKEISQILEDIYHRLQNIFNNWSTTQFKENNIFSPKEFKEVGGDQQLYEMLNDFKQQNKKQKQLRKKVESQNAQLHKKIQKIENQKIRLINMQKQTTIQLQHLIKRLSENDKKRQILEDMVSKEREQKQDLNIKIDQLTETIGQLSESQKSNQMLIIQLDESKNRQMQLSKKLQGLNAIIKSKIQEKENKWHQLIQQKINSSTVFEKPLCQSFRNFMSVNQQLNVNLNKS